MRGRRIPNLRQIRLRERDQSPGEEIANSVSHALGGIVAVIAAIALVATAVERGGLSGIVGAAVFATTMVFVYVTSTIYHGLPRNRAKRVFKVLDHSAIFLLIAGTYTPFTLGVMRGMIGWSLLVLVWALAVAGVVFTAVSRIRYPTICTLIYLAMGWLILIGVKPLWEHMAPWGLFWLAAGGLAYTGGIVFFAADRVRFGHLVWHLCVIAGTACHYVAVYRYAA
jgi:hemolysin III